MSSPASSPAAIPAPLSPATTIPATSVGSITHIYYKYCTINSHRVFYRESGDSSQPTLLLLHGFPTSSHMFRSLIPLLTHRYHMIAPDLPGFGFTQSPPRPIFDYTFDNLAKVMEDFTDAIGLTRYAIYVFDYGAPVGLRLALARPERVFALITQNGNAYEEGLSDGWQPIQRYWKDPSVENRNSLRDALLTLVATKWQYVHGVEDESLVAPEAYHLDQALLDRAGNDEIQLDLFKDYANNVSMYPVFHRYFSQYQPPLLAVWGKNDPFFLPQGAEAFKRDLPQAQVELLNTGHFALETHAGEIAQRMLQFLDKLKHLIIKDVDIY